MTSQFSRETKIDAMNHQCFDAIFILILAGWDYPGGSQTLPNRKGNKRVNLKPLSVDDSEVVIKKQGLNGVKIQLSNLNEKEIQTSLDFNYDQHEHDLKNNSATAENSDKDKRKYGLEELEVEGFSSASSCSKHSEFDQVLEDEDDEEEVDLNSLIEGDVDEIDEEIGKRKFKIRISKSGLMMSHHH